MSWRLRRPLAVGAAACASAPLAAAFEYRRRRSEDGAARQRGLARCAQAPPCAAPAASFVEAKFMGLHKKGLVPLGTWHVVTLYPPMGLGNIWDTIRYFLNIVRPHVVVKVYNAREQEAIEGLSKVEFFHKYGFVLLPRKTAMTAVDWNLSAPITLDLSHFTGYGMPQRETPVSRIYAKEVEQIVRELFPDSKELELDTLVARRGPGTKNPTYSFAAHNDYGFVADDWPVSNGDFKGKFASPEVRGMMAVNFWRPVLPMQGPVRKTPLAVCDPRSVSMEDIVPTSIKWDHMPHHKMLSLAHDEGQRWYYYPDMTVDEVLVFKSFQYFKHQAGPEFNTCFHTAFEDPTAPPHSEERQSAEYRVRIWF